MTWKRIKHFLHEDNSIWSWLANILLAFLLIRFIIYPVLGLIMGTPFPVVAVVSGSMEHDGAFDTWWQSSCGPFTQADLYASLDIQQQQFQFFRFRNGFDAGDVIVLTGVRPENVKVGDVLVYWTSRPEPIIHRVISVNEGSYTFKGDHNCGSNPDEVAVTPDRIIGRAWMRLPYLGYVKLMAMKLVAWVAG